MATEEVTETKGKEETYASHEERIHDQPSREKSQSFLKAVAPGIGKPIDVVCGQWLESNFSDSEGK
jgi:hypothetical protein